MQDPSVYLINIWEETEKKKRHKIPKKIKGEGFHTLKKDNSDNLKGYTSSNISLIERKS